MKLLNVVDILNAEVHSGANKFSLVIEPGFASDLLLSEVIAGAKKGQLWFTVQTHPNIVAVALLTDFAVVIITGGHKPDPVTIAKAETEKVSIISTDYQTFEAIRILL